jgi:hypothetical protein
VFWVFNLPIFWAYFKGLRLKCSQKKKKGGGGGGGGEGKKLFLGSQCF